MIRWFQFHPIGLRLLARMDESTVDTYSDLRKEIQGIEAYVLQDRYHPLG
jgi:hypothetical protein